MALNGERTQEEYQEILEVIIEQCSSLQTLLNQLLLLSEAEAEALKTQVEPVEFDRLVSRSMAMFQGVAEVHNIKLRVSRLDPCRLAGNKVHLAQLINNLIDNALKYTQPGGQVEVSLVNLPDGNGVESLSEILESNRTGRSAETLRSLFSGRSITGEEHLSGRNRAWPQYLQGRCGGPRRNDCLPEHRRKGTEFRVHFPFGDPSPAILADRELSPSL